MIELIPVQTAIFAASGGVIFALAIHYLFEFFSVIRVGTKDTLVLMAAVAIAFWGTGIMPLLVTLRRPPEFVVLVTLMFVLFCASCLFTTYLLARSMDRR